MFLKSYPYRVWCSIFYSKLVNCIILRSLFVFVKGRGTCGSGERNVKIWIDFRKSPRFPLTSPLSQEREKSSRPVFAMCDEPWMMSRIDSWYWKFFTGPHFQNGRHNTAKIQHCSISKVALIYFLNRLSVAGLGDFIIVRL